VLDVPVIAVHARADDPARAAARHDRIAIAAAQRDVEGLWHALGEVARRLLPAPDAVALNHRQRTLCAEAAAHCAAAAAETDLLLVAERLRLARACFDAITGRAGVEAMLDAMFSRFCIGK
jgi:tRNA modification GTPase